MWDQKYIHLRDATDGRPIPDITTKMQEENSKVVVPELL